MPEVKSTATSELKIYILNNDPHDHCRGNEDNIDWCCVVANSEEMALGMAMAKLDHDCRPGDNWRYSVHVTSTHEVPDSKWMGHVHFPRYVTKPQELRLFQFREERESYCECCDLAANGIEMFHVCDDCLVCEECGGCRCPSEKTPTVGR